MEHYIIKTDIIGYYLSQNLYSIETHLPKI